MTKRYVSLLLVLFLFFTCLTSISEAFWMWTPDTNKWINPKYSVKDTPQEQLEYAQEFLKMGDFSEAIDQFKKLIKHYPKAREAAQAQYSIGKALDEQGQLFDAFKEYQKVVDKYPYSNLAGEVVQKQFDIGNRLLEGAEKRNEIIEKLSGADYNVIDVFKAVIKNAPYGELAASSQYKIGLYLLEKGLYNEARDEFEKTMNDYPESEWARAAKYQVAVTDAKRSTQAQYDQKVTQSAVEEFKDFVATYPDAELSEEAKAQIQRLRDKEAENAFIVAEFYAKQKNYKAAKLYFQSVVNEHPKSSWASKSLERIREVSQLTK